MKKIIALLSSISIASSAILSFSSSTSTSITQQNKIQNLTYTKNNVTISTKSTNDENINLFITKLNDENEKDGSYYDDEIFLKSLSFNVNPKNSGDINTKIELHSSESNLEKTNKTLLSKNKMNTNDINLDDQEYEKIAKIKDENNNSRIDTSITLLNRYLSNGLLSYNPNGTTSSREEVLTNGTDQQNIITFNSSLTSRGLLTSMSDYVEFGFHLTHWDIVLKPELINAFIIGAINKALNYAFEEGITKVSEELADVISKWVLRTTMEFGATLIVEVTLMFAEFWWLEMVLTPLEFILTYVLSNYLASFIKKVILYSVTTGVEYIVHKLIVLAEDKIATYIDPGSTFLGLKITIGEGFGISLYSEETEHVVTPSVIIPALPDNKLTQAGTLLGSGNNAVLYLNSAEMNTFLYSKNPKEFLTSSNINNDYITLNESDWTNILDEIYYSEDYSPISTKHAGIIVIRNGNLEYTNANSTDFNNLVTDNNYLLASIIKDKKNNSEKLLITNNQIQNLINTFNYINLNWDQIESEENPSENNPEDYFYDNYLINFLDIGNLTKEEVINDFKKVKDSISNFINMTAETNSILNIDFSSTKIEFNN